LYCCAACEPADFVVADFSRADLPELCKVRSSDVEHAGYAGYSSDVDYAGHTGCSGDTDVDYAGYAGCSSDADCSSWIDYSASADSSA